MDRRTGCGRTRRAQMIAKWTKVAFISSVAFTVVLAAIVPTAAQGPLVRNIAQPPGSRTIAVRTANADGVKLQYLTAGRGRAVLLRPGIGGSDIPKDGLDMKGAAIRIHDLVKGLGIEKAVVVGHDIGLMVAYAYAARFPAETERLVLMDAFLPGVDGWETIYNDPRLWHFRFHGSTPEALIAGRERTYLDYYWNEFAADRTRSIPEADRQAYTAAY